MVLHEHQELYFQSMENQIRVNEKMVEQYVLEKAKMQMRMEALENPNHMQLIKDDIDRLHQEVQSMKSMNIRLQVEQSQNVDQLKKFSDSYKSEENHQLKTIKQIKEDI